jgi:hypothetical protein
MCCNCATRHLPFYVFAAPAPLQNNFPEHLGCMFMINTPLLFRGFWSVIKGFLDERTLAKIKVGGTVVLCGCRCAWLCLQEQA